MNKKFHTVDIETGHHYLDDPPEIDSLTIEEIGALLIGENGISTGIDYEAQPHHIHITFENAVDGGIVVNNALVYLDQESVWKNRLGDDDDLLEIDFLKDSTDSENCIAIDVAETNPAGDLIRQHNKHEHFYVHGDPNYYFIVRLQGEFGANSSDNDQSTDFTNNPIFSQLFGINRNDYTNVLGDWNLLFSKRHDYSTGNSIVFDDTFILELNELTYLAYNLNDANDNIFESITRPIQNFELFWKRITVTRRKKTSWFNTYQIPATANDGVSLKTGEMPSDSLAGLPFIGWYEFHAKVNVKEGTSSGLNDANVGTAQTFDLRPKLGSYTNIDKSITHESYNPGEDNAQNNSLQGSVMLHITDATVSNRKIQYKIYLPNGNSKQIIDGYIHVKYKGKTIGIDRY